MAALLHCTILLFFLFAALLKGLKGETEAQQNVAVKVGDEACLECPLVHSKDVLQVMWQKILPKKEVTLATCNSFRPNVNPVFSGKIKLRGTGLWNCSIVVRNVTEQDEGCYLCLSITSSDTAFTGTTCLHMYEFYEPILNVSESNSTGDLIVSCSATGRPAPTVTLNIQEKIWTHNKTVDKRSETNPNGTVTVTTTAVLARFYSNSATVGCSVRSPFVSERQVFTAISGFDLKSGPKASDSLIVALCIGLAIGGVAIATAVLLVMKQQKSSDLEENRREKNKVTHETPLNKGF